MLQTLILEENEQKIKKTWLKITIVRMVVCTVLSLLLNTLAFVLDSMSVKEWAVFSAIALFFPLLYLWILYRCAYKKLGNKFLMFTVVEGSYVAVSTFMKLLKDPHIFLWSLFIFNSLLYLFWAYHSQKVIYIHKKYKQKTKEMTTTS
jgi:hypothetical protein